MNPEHLERLCVDFNLGKVHEIEENHEGVLNKNYVVKTDKGNFFIKSVREKKKGTIPHIAEVESLMVNRGIPAITMRTNTSGSTYSEYDSEVYTVYPFLQSSRTHQYSLADMYEMGALLGKIHLAGSANISKTLKANEFSENDPDTILASANTFKKMILEKNTADETDVVFLTYIDQKLKLIPILKPVEFTNDTLVHGDYHARNLLFNESKEIIGICDWEKAEMAPRAYEVARSIQYICFEPDSGLYEEVKAVEQSRSFLEGYNFTYPISKEELTNGFALRLRKLAHSVWLENQYYTQGDTRANKFIANETRLLRDFSSAQLVENILTIPAFPS